MKEHEWFLLNQIKTCEIIAIFPFSWKTSKVKLQDEQRHEL